MTKNKKRIENMAHNVKEQLLKENIIDKCCRLSLGVLFIIVALTMILLTFNIVLFNLSNVLNAGKLLIFEMLLVFSIMFIRIKNQDNIVNKFLDELDNK